MSATINNWNTTPPGMWRFKVAQTGHWLRDFYAYNDLEDAARAYYKANALPFPSDFRQQLVDQMCDTLPPGWCKNGGRLADVGAAFSHEFQRVLQGTATLVNWFLAGREKVPSVEAERRAIICATCIFNRAPQGCTACNVGAVTKLVQQVVGGVPTSQDAKLLACQICGCDLKAKVWLPLAVLQRHIPAKQQEQFPPAYRGFAGCWLREPSALPL